MKQISVADPAEILNSLGNLHDVRIDRMSFDVEAESCLFDLEDLNTNFERFPGYQGERGVSLVLDNVRALTIDVETAEGVRINNVVLERDGGRWRLSFDLNLGGGDLTKGRRSVSVLFETFKIYER